ncbi:Damage response protein 1 [Mycena sanguinolenta]|uniref:Damage response protein 1 n=1 Tax=Mycena sanguinolenta TaxID=230812 RepID=A0A8H6YLP4_9AGAR|nr:Damage response protein 1 [Mycena sanguinolenta]
MGFTLQLGTPVNTALFVFILYSVQRIVFPRVSKPATIPREFKAGYSWMPKSHPPTVLFKTFTPKTLEPFSGRDGGRILLAINGIVFDVTAGRNFYGPNGMYGNFAGRDASRGMAKQSFDKGPLVFFCVSVRITNAAPEMLTPIDQPLDKLADLQPDEIDNMKGWIDHFSNKYIICGKLVENDAI